MIELRERFLGVFRVGVLVVSVSVGVRGIEVLFLGGGGGDDGLLDRCSGGCGVSYVGRWIWYAGECDVSSLV